jgi:hypothetical protein
MMVDSHVFRKLVDEGFGGCGREKDDYESVVLQGTRATRIAIGKCGARGPQRENWQPSVASHSTEALNVRLCSLESNRS